MCRVVGAARNPTHTSHLLDVDLFFSGVIGGKDGKMVLFCMGFYETLVEWETGTRIS